MTQTQEDKLSMYYAVNDTCERASAQWAANAIFSASYDLWVAKIPAITDYRMKQNAIVTGFAVDKSNKRGIMIALALFLINRVQSYASVSKDTVLFNSVKYSPRDLKKARDTDAVGICEIIYNIVDSLGAVLLPFGVTPAMITDLQSAITNFSISLAQPVGAIAMVKTATENIARLFQEADDLLTTRLDLDIEMFKTSDPDFYGQYKSARMIISTGNRKNSVMGNVTLAETGEAMQGVVLSFAIEPTGLMATQTPKPLVKKSAKKGNFIIASLPEGNYSVTVKKIGFKEQVLSVIVADGETSKVKVKMEKI